MKSMYLGLLMFFLSTSYLISQNEVKIGNQVWMSKNLDVDKFRNGDKIPEVNSDKEWMEADRRKQPAWCYYYEDLSSFKHKVYKEAGIKVRTDYKNWGKLYNWYAVNDKRGLAPTGWRIPSEDEWIELINFLGGKVDCGEKLRLKSVWGKAVKATNSSGFCAFPSGWRATIIGFWNLGKAAYWTSTISESSLSKNTISAKTVFLNDGLNEWFTDNVDYYSYPAGSGLSVRCIKD
jgi:uncharacterized protein (TIGR02145 family)